MTQADLAAKLNYSDKAVSKWERGESLPDITVIKDISEIFCVSVDYLLSEEHDETPPEAVRAEQMNRFRVRVAITGISILLVWLIATFTFVIIDIISPGGKGNWLTFLYAIPVSLIVWLVMNSVWFRKRWNFFIISLLVWSVLGAVHLSLLTFGIHYWLIYTLGIPGQAIILLWASMNSKRLAPLFHLFQGGQKKSEEADNQNFSTKK